MNRSTNRLLARISKQCLPPLLVHWLTKRFQQVRYVGNYANWQQAQAASDGYDSDLILDRVCQATDKVIAGEAICERDGVALDQANYPWPVIYALQRTAIEQPGNSLHVTDFGGSLGSTWRHIAPLLNDQINLQWSVIEQPHFVAMGQQRYSTDKLHFFTDAQTCHAQHPPQVLLLSGVLPYLPQPYEMLKQLLAMPYSMVIIDRMMCQKGIEDRLALQHVPKAFYGRKVNYPVWLLSFEKLIKVFEQAGYTLRFQKNAYIDSSETAHDRYNDQMMIFKKQSDTTPHA
ncbi:MAG: methyltransferase, TIGR04325 family [Phycisphaeraceae bacterium]|nr:methyltransferase, TIGR04325 family [Phycisphaeraceae bacterium]